METLASPSATPAFTAVMNLFDLATPGPEERFAAGLGAVHGLSLKDTLLLMYVAHAEGGRLSRIELAKRLSVSPSTVTRTTAREARVPGRREPRARCALCLCRADQGGQRAVADAEATLARLADEVFRDRWSAAEVKSLSSLLLAGDLIPVT